MFKNKYPLFKDGRILKIEMLEELRNFPRDFLNIKFEEYSNGIILGCNIDVNDNFIFIKKGIIKHDGVLYILSDSKAIKYESNNKLMILKIKFLPPIKDNDFIESSTEIYLDEDLNIGIDEMEICRFKLRSGAILRTKHVNFNDLSTEYDTLNTINVPYSAHEGSTISSTILKKFGEELLEYNTNEPWDIYFGIMCIQAKDPIEKSIVIKYISNKLNIRVKDYSNEQIYFYLLNVLKKLKQGKSSDINELRGRYKKILVD